MTNELKSYKEAIECLNSIEENTKLLKEFLDKQQPSIIHVSEFNAQLESFNIDGDIEL